MQCELLCSKFICFGFYAFGCPHIFCFLQQSAVVSCCLLAKSGTQVGNLSFGFV